MNAARSNRNPDYPTAGPAARRRKRRALLLGALAVPLLAAPAAAQTVEASGQGQATVTVSRPLTQFKIARAVDIARDKAVPRALINAQVQANRYAFAAGLTLGAIQSVSEPVSSPYGYYFGPYYGRFGPNRYCGRVTTVKRKVVNGKRKVVSKKTRFRCFKPEFMTVSLSVTFAATPVAPVAP